MKITLFLLISLLAADVSFAFGKKRKSGGTPVPASTPASTDVSGNYPTANYEYKLPASIDSMILPGVTTEIWGRLYFPVQNIVRNPRSGDLERRVLPNRPLILLLHGNHETCSDMALEDPQISCQYTYQGSCPTGQKVVQNHMGYDYFARRLASHGFAVASINANRGITCGQPVSGDNGLNLARGRLILKHLALLRKWSVGGQPSTIRLSIKNAFDFSQVGLFGHSRGGEGVRAAYNLYKDAGSPWPTEIGANIGFRAIFEIGPVDGQTNRTLDAVGAAWNVLLPMCDGDVSNLQGMKPFDRMISAGYENPTEPKSMMAVWGANHNFYNTMWNRSDSPGCTFPQNQLWAGNGESPGQQTTALQSILPFFRGNLGATADSTLAKVFEPSAAIPQEITNVTRIDRAYFVSSSNETFTLLKPLLREAQNVVYTADSSVKEHLVTATKISWDSASSTNYYQEKWANVGEGYDSNSIRTLNFRVSRTESTLNTTFNTSFQVRLIYSSAVLSSPVSISNYTELTGPVGIPGNVHQVLQTVRIPLAAFGVHAFNPKHIRGVRFIFNQTASGEINIANVAFDHAGPIPEPSNPGGRIASGGRTYSGSLASVNTSENPSSVWNLDRLGSFSLLSKKFANLSLNPNTIIGNFIKFPTKNTPDKIIRVTRIASSYTSGRTGDVIEIEVESQHPFPARDALPVLTFNGKALGLGRVPSSGNLKRMIFTMPASEISSLPDSFDLGVAHVEDMEKPIRSYGSYSRNSLFDGI